MNWISNYVRPRINSIFSRREVPENLWTKCDECGQMLFHRELAANLNVCPNCGHHMAIRPRERFQAFFDGGWVETPVYDYGRLGRGTRLEGPAIVESPFTTIVLPPGSRAELDRYLNLVIEP